MINFELAAQITQGKVLQKVYSSQFCYLLTDSRKIIVHPEAVFFAIVGTRHNGHHYIDDLYKKGIRQFIVQENIAYKNYPQANFLQVEDTICALQGIAAYHRKQFHIPIIAITGSNAKTIIKEWLSDLLSAKFNVLKSPKSYNSQIGVPLSVYRLNETHQIAVFEAGISQPGEMGILQKIIQPTIGVFTNIGAAHEKNFSGNYDLKIQEKALLFKDVDVVFYCRDHEKIHHNLNKQLHKRIKKISWSIKDKSATIQYHLLNKKDTSTSIQATFEKKQHIFQLPFSDEASLENALHCIAILLYFKFNNSIIQTHLSKLKAIKMRLELLQGIHGCFIIDDSYNNDLDGLRTALDFLEQQHQHPKKTLILSDILDTSNNEKKIYQEAATILFKEKNKLKINRLIGIGTAISANQNLFQIPEKQFFDSTEDFLKYFQKNIFKDEIILIKGARKFQFEKIIQKLQRKTHGTRLEINLNALTNNLNFYRSHLSPSTRLMVMVKALAYGSGNHEIASLLAFHKVDYLAVAYADEGVTLRKNGITLPIMVMNPTTEDFENIISYNLEPEIYSLRIFYSLINFLPHHNKKTKIHLKIDTGMHRLGFDDADIPELITQLKNNNKHIKVSSIFTHLAAQDEKKHHDFTTLQIKKFLQIYDEITLAIKQKPLRHILNSAGIINYPHYHFDMVRLGIGLYGVDVTHQYQDEIQPISTLKTTISQIKDIKKGETIGYSRKGIATNPLRLATIAIGYADGFDRRFSNSTGAVWIQGKLAPVIGNVCMDMCMVNITSIPNVHEGDDVEIFGLNLPIIELSQRINVIPYEILTGISERVKRVYYTE